MPRSHPHPHSLAVAAILLLLCLPALVACGGGGGNGSGTGATSTSASATGTAATATQQATAGGSPASADSGETTTPASSATPTATATATVTSSPTVAPTPSPAVRPAQAHQLPGGTLKLPGGFSINVYADNLGMPRFMAVRPSDGMLFVTDESGGRILILPDANHDGKADKTLVFASGLNKPSSIAFYQDWLYVGETNQISRFPDANNALTPTGPEQVVVPNLPNDGEHFTRTVVFGPDNKLYVAVGSSCNVCVEQDPRRAAISVYDADGKNGRIYASGLRNAVGLAFQPGTSQLWATVNGRDNLGDNLPPDELRKIDDGVFYGWPYCYNGPHPNPEFNDPAKCKNVPPATVALPAHSAALGLTFGNGLKAPQVYQDSIYIAYHGSWNRSVPTGYKVVRVPLTNGKAGQPQDFAWGWLPGNPNNPGDVWGRPVGVTIGGDGALYVSDDTFGLVYRIAWTG